MCYNAANNNLDIRISNLFYNEVMRCKVYIPGKLLVMLGLLKNVSLLRRCAPRNDKRFVLPSLRAIRRIARQSQMLLWDFFNSPMFTDL